MLVRTRDIDYNISDIEKKKHKLNILATNTMENKKVGESIEAERVEVDHIESQNASTSLNFTPVDTRSSSSSSSAI